MDENQVTSSEGALEPELEVHRDADPQEGNLPVLFDVEHVNLYYGSKQALKDINLQSQKKLV